MRRLAALTLIALAAAGCGVDLYEAPGYQAAAVPDGVALWRLTAGPAGFVAVGGEISLEDLEADPGPLPMRSYRSSDGWSWEEGAGLGSVEATGLGLTGWDGGYAASGLWDGAPTLAVSADGVAWERTVLPGGGSPVLEPAGLAAAGGVIVVTGSDPSGGLKIWTVAPGGAAAVATDGFPTGTRLPQVTAGPGGFAAAALGTVDPVPPIWVSPDGSTWDPVLDPFGGATGVTGLIGSADGYVAVVADPGDDRRFTLWTSADGVSWTARADQDTVYEHLQGTGGPLYRDLVAPPGEASGRRPIAFTLDGRWLEITEAHAGERFVTVSVAADASVRLASGFRGGDTPAPLLLVAAP